MKNITRRNFLKLAGKVIAAVAVYPVIKLLKPSEKTKEAKGLKEAMFYTRGDHLAG